MKFSAAGFKEQGIGKKLAVLSRFHSASVIYVLEISAVEKQVNRGVESALSPILFFKN